MKVVFTRRIFQQIFDIVYSTKERPAVSLFGTKDGERCIVQEVRSATTLNIQVRSGEGCEPHTALEGLRMEHLGILHCQGARMCRLSGAEVEMARAALREHEEFLTGVMTRSKGGVAVYPVYFSREIPGGVDIPFEYEGTTVLQPRSALYAGSIRKRRVRPRIKPGGKRPRK